MFAHYRAGIRGNKVAAQPSDHGVGVVFVQTVEGEAVVEQCRHLEGHLPSHLGVDPSMRPYREGLFGPVAVLNRVESAEHAVAIANDSPFGLGAAVFGCDEARARDVADQLDVGMVGINTTVKSAPDLPFGGVKASRLGRELGRFGLDEFANKKLVRRVEG